MKLGLIIVLIFGNISAGQETVLKFKKTLKNRVLPTIVDQRSVFYRSDNSNNTNFYNAAQTYSKSVTIIFVVVLTFVL